MSDDLIRASLDQALLAMKAIDEDNLPAAAVHAALSGALASLTSDTGTTTGASRGGTTTRGYENWKDDLARMQGIEPVNPPELPAPVDEIPSGSPGQRRMDAIRAAREA